MLDVRMAETADDLRTVFTLIESIYGEELGDWPLVEQERVLLLERGGGPARHFLAFDDGHPVGAIRVHFGADGPFSGEDREAFGIDAFTSIVPPAQIALLSRLLCTKAHRGSATSLMMQLKALEFGLARDVQLAFCDCRPHLLNTYRRLGFRPYRRTFNSPTAGMLVPLVFFLMDVEFLRQVGSPLLYMIEQAGPDPSLVRRLVALLPAHRVTHTVESYEQAAQWVHAAQAGVDRIHVFDGLAPEDIDRVIAGGNVIECAEADLLIRHGTDEQTLFVVLSGTLEVFVGEALVDVAVEGDLLGEMAFLLNSQRTAAVRAATDDVRVLSLSLKNIQRLEEEHPRTAMQLYKNVGRILSLRITHMHRHLPH